MRYGGRCHCGSIEVAFAPDRPAPEVELRECACTFCRRHGAAGVSDPGGRLEITLRDAGEVSRYRFGLRTADFLVCRTCGVYVAAVCEIMGRTYGVLNANVLDDRSAFTHRPVRADFEGETAAERLARRQSSWTPAEVRESAGPFER